MNRGQGTLPGIGPSGARPWIKVCGVRTLRDVELCARAGATHVGLNAWPRSPRYLPPRDLGAVARAVLREGLVPVVVWVPGSPLDGRFLRGLDPLPFQSPAPPPLVLAGRAPNPRTAWVESRQARPGPLTALPRGDVLLVDAYLPGAPGGTGRRAEAALLRQVPRPFVLAGGLGPDNVAEAIFEAAPAGVDAASGLESSPGVKDPGKVRAYCQAAREAFRIVRRETSEVTFADSLGQHARFGVPPSTSPLGSDVP
jgi:phosphoribosylanthranilate isomerase